MGPRALPRSVGRRSLGGFLPQKTFLRSEDVAVRGVERELPSDGVSGATARPIGAGEPELMDLFAAS